MPTRKIPETDRWPLPCVHPEHNPPSLQVFEPGLYEHICPACGARQMFRVNPLTATEIRETLAFARELAKKPYHLSEGQRAEIKAGILASMGHGP